MTTVAPDTILTADATALPRVLAPRDVGNGLAPHLNRLGLPPYRGGKGLLIPTMHASGLTGRGGAAFPMARKLDAVLHARGRAVVVANGAEGEPAAAKDKQLLWSNPHLVLDGLQLAAEAVHANEAYLYVHRNASLVSVLRRALDERASRRGVDRLKVTIVEAPARFIAGQESAVVNRIEGGPALPRFSTRGVYEAGVRGRPTLVQNVETLAHLALVARFGADWFRAVGTVDEPGTMLLSVRSATGAVHVAEASIGTPMRDVLGADAAGSAVLVGGYHGAWLAPEHAATIALSNLALRPHGAALGAGVLAALPQDRCGVRETARVVRYLAHESAGQCGPCLNGLPRIATALASLAQPRANVAARSDLERWSGLVERRGACHHPDGTVRLVRSALLTFSGELDRHARGLCTGRSAAGFLPTPGAVPVESSWN